MGLYPNTKPRPASGHGTQEHAAQVCMEAIASLGHMGEGGGGGGFLPVLCREKSVCHMRGTYV